MSMRFIKVGICEVLSGSINNRESSIDSHIGAVAVAIGNRGFFLGNLPRGASSIYPSAEVSLRTIELRMKNRSSAEPAAG